MCDLEGCKGPGDLRFASFHLIAARKAMIKASLVAAAWWVEEGAPWPPVWDDLDNRAQDLVTARADYNASVHERVEALGAVVHVGDTDAGQGGDKTG